MSIARPEIISWVAVHILPREPRVRAALRRVGIADSEIDDVIQDAYCRIAALGSVGHVEEPGAYFMQIAKNLYRDRLRKASLVRFEDINFHANLVASSDDMDVEAAVDARQQLRLINRLLELLPERCAAIFRLRRIEGLSQKEIARRLDVTESVVENDVQKALKLIQSELRGVRTKVG